MTDGQISKQPATGRDPVPPSKCYFVGLVEKSDRDGYLRFTTLTDPSTSYDLPEYWFSDVGDTKKLRVNLEAVDDRHAKQAFRSGNNEASVSFDDLAKDDLILLGILPGRTNIG